MIHIGYMIGQTIGTQLQALEPLYLLIPKNPNFQHNWTKTDSKSSDPISFHASFVGPIGFKYHSTCKAT